MADNIPDNIEAEIKKSMRPGVHEFKTAARDTARDTTQQAMQRVDEREALDVLQMESLVDQALSVRISAVRGKYVPGPRDAYVRRRVVEWIMTITADNGGMVP